MNSRKTNRIGIAVVEHQRQFLVGVRDTDAPLAGFHEFPGGKCEVDESAAECVVRECLEETGLKVIAVKELLYEEHSYAHADLKLHFWLCHPSSLSTNLENQNRMGFQWIAVDHLRELRFPEANGRLIDLLLSSYAKS